LETINTTQIKLHSWPFPQPTDQWPNTTQHNTTKPNQTQTQQHHQNNQRSYQVTQLPSTTQTNKPEQTVTITKLKS